MVGDRDTPEENKWVFPPDFTSSAAHLLLLSLLLLPNPWGLKARCECISGSGGPVFGRLIVTHLKKKLSREIWISFYKTRKQKPLWHVNSGRFTKVFSWKESDTLQKERTSLGLWVERYRRSCSSLLWCWLLGVTTQSLDTVLNQFARCLCLTEPHVSVCPVAKGSLAIGSSATGSLLFWSCLSRRKGSPSGSRWQGMYSEQGLSGVIK